MTLTKRLAQGRIYYGWYIVAAAFIAQGVSIGIQGFTFGFFLKPMSADLGWSRAELSAVQSISTIVTGVLAVFIGSLLDRRGGRELAVAGALISGAGLVVTAFVEELWQFYFVRGILVTAGMLFVGNLVMTVTIANWFVRQRGRAVAVGIMGVSLAGIILAPLTQALIAAYGWRWAWAALGLAIVIIVALPCGLLMRRRPEDMGLLPDGDHSPLPSSAQNGETPARSMPTGAEYRWERRQAVRTTALWLIILGFALSGMAAGGFMLHLVPYLTDKGFSPQVAAISLSVIGVAGLLCKPIWGFLVEKVPGRYCTAFEFALCALTIGLILMSNSETSVYATAFLVGAGFSGNMVLQEVIWADYFGRFTLGAIRSVGMPFAIVSSAGGPLFAGAAYDSLRSYEFAFIVFALTLLLAAVVILLSRRPVPPSEAG